MTLRRRLALLTAAAVALAVILASAIAYALVRDSLRDQVDDDLRERADRAVVRIPAPGQGPPGRPAYAPPGSEAPAPPPAPGQGDVLALPPPPDPGGPPALGQVIAADGSVKPAPGPSSELSLPVSDSARRVAAEGGDPLFEDADAEGTPLRVLTQPLPEGGALQVARSLESTEETLDTLLLVLAVVSAGGIALGAALGPVVARTALAPAAEVSAAAEDVARTRDLTRRIEARGDDELGRLASSFNEMMEALERSEASQRRLVADASHELRTPLATLRTNIEALGRNPDLDPRERERLVQDLADELEEMTDLVGDVVELAREPGRLEGVESQEVRLDELARDAVERARRRNRGLRFVQRLTPTVVRGDPQRLGRAISNLLENAGKWSPEGGEIEVEVTAGRVRVRDHGPGFAREDLPLVFERFWRADSARGKPGSGLGLAIVRRVADEHGGSVDAANAEGGGAEVSLALPGPPEAAS